jgi:rhamnose transport system permease protein
MSAPATRRLTRRVSWETLLAILLVAAIAAGGILNPDFLSAANWTNLLANFVEIALMALPLCLIVIAKEIDLSVASILGLSSALLGVLWQARVPMPIAILLCLLAGALAGAMNGYLIVRFGLPSLAVTIGTLGLYRGLAFVLLGDQAIADFPPEYTEFGYGVVPFTFLPTPFALFLLLAALFWILVHHTAFGRSLYAIGGNQTAARFSGINIDRTKMQLFVASGIISALAGIIFTFRFASARADNGTGFELSAVAAVLLGGVTVQGGKGTVAGVVLSLLLIGVINNALTLVDVSNEILTIVTGSLVIFSVLLPNFIATAREKLRVLGRQRTSAIPPSPSRQSS